MTTQSLKGLTYLTKIGRRLALMLPGTIRYIAIKHDSLYLFVTRDSLLSILTFLKKSSFTRFTSIMDIVGIDYPARVNRFHLVYCLLSIEYNTRIFVKVAVPDQQGVPSVVPLWSSAGWFERQVWDMFGILFIGNNDLRRILTDYGFTGHPLRKDFPLLGYEELRYTESGGRVIAETVEVAQEFRTYEYQSPWITNTFQNLNYPKKL